MFDSLIYLTTVASHVLTSLVAAFLVSVLLIFLCIRYFGPKKTRALADLAWIVIGGAGAIATFVTAHYISSIESTLNRVHDTKVRLSIADRVFSSVKESHCKDFSAFSFDSQISPPPTNSCIAGQRLLYLRENYPYLWQLGQTKQNQLEIEERANHDGEIWTAGDQVRIATSVSMSLAGLKPVGFENSDLLFDSGLESRFSSQQLPSDENEPTLPWFCYGLVRENDSECIGPPKEWLANLSLSPQSNNGIIIVGAVDPVAAAIQTYIFDLAMASLVIREARGQSQLLFSIHQIEGLRLLGFFLLSLAFPLRAWRSFHDWRHGI